MIERLADLGDSPERTAAALAIGVPQLLAVPGVQIAPGLTAALAFRLHRLGLCTNLPMIMVPWYAITTGLAAAALGSNVGPDVNDRLRTVFSLPIYQAEFWSRSLELLAPSSGPS